MPPTDVTAASHRLRHLRVRTLLVVVVLVPVIGMVALATVAAASAMDKRELAVRVQDEVETLVDIAAARTAIAAEETDSSVVASAADLGADVDLLNDLYGIDFGARLDEARNAVDADATLDSIPEIDDSLDRLPDVRAALDAGTASFAEVSEFFGELTADLDQVWLTQWTVLQERLSSADISGAVHERAWAFRATFEALRWGSQRAASSIILVQGEPDAADRALLIEATIRHRVAVEDYIGLLGPRGEAVYGQLQADPNLRRFEETLDEIAATVVAGTTSPLATDPVAFGDAFIHGAAWGAGLSELVLSAGADLQAVAAHQEREATAMLRDRIVVASLLTLLAIAGALLLARAVARPIRRLQQAAHEIQEGRFDLEPIEPSGPRELSDTAIAFNEMTSTLAMVETHAVALADDPDAAFLNHQLPGRTGRALQVALNRLRASIRSAEDHRRDLEVAATHDSLTGLLNRAAALTMIERDLARADRRAGSVMALFIDLDGFKTINDEHGHAAGDDALRLTSEALRAATRHSDVVARLGGDEFLIAGIIDDDDRAEVEDLAERIREAVASVELAGVDGRIPLHCSIGMALSEQGTLSVDELIHRADSALYLAKRRGRDQAAWPEHPEASDATSGVDATP